MVKRNYHKKFHEGRILLFLLMTALFDVLGIMKIDLKAEQKEREKMTISNEIYRSLFFSEQMFEKEDSLSKECKIYLKNVRNEVKYFPVPESTQDASLRVVFENSWLDSRKYGGKRKHEGTDIMAKKNQRGLYPIVSMTDGKIVNLGWNEKGGYRVGVSADSGTYYYYAHMESYGNVKKGDSVKAGEFLGYMGDSGYGKEGTTGKFAVHLHVGIYFYNGEEEISINPYFLLKYLEKRKLKYKYF